MAIGPLALVGGSEWESGCDFDANLAQAADASEVLVVAAAAAYERPGDAVEKARLWFSKLGLGVADSGILTRGDANNADLAAKVREARFVYVADGSAMHLRSVLKDSAVLEALYGMWRAGGAVAGSSAGAMVLTDPMVDPRGGAFTLGFGFVRNLTAVPHWGRWTGEMSHRMVRLAPAETVIAEIQERTALIRWADGSWATEGAGDVTLLKDAQTLAFDQLASVVEL